MLTGWLKASWPESAKLFAVQRCNVALCMMYFFIYWTFKCSREVENAFRKSFSIELDWPHLSVVSLAIEGGKTLCNRVEVTRGAAKWITSELFAAGHIRRWTINLRGFHMISFCIHRATTCKWHRKCSKCTCQLSALTVHISIIQLLKSNSRTDPHRISIEREREKCEKWKIFKIPNSQTEMRNSKSFQSHWHTVSQHTYSHTLAHTLSGFR